MSQKLVFGLTLQVAQNIKEEVEREVLRKSSDIQSVCRYRREGVYQYVKQQEEVLIILEEFLQGKDSYPKEELQQLTDLGNNRIVFLLERSHVGDDYIKALYCCGIYDGLYLDEATPKEIMKLIRQGRTTEQARKYYGIKSFRDAEKDGNFVNEERVGLYMEYLEAETGKEDLGEKYRFVSTRLGADENRILASNLTGEATRQLRGNEVFEFYKGADKGKRRLFAWKKKTEKSPNSVMPQTEERNHEIIVPTQKAESGNSTEEDDIFHAIDRFWAMGSRTLEDTVVVPDQEQEDLRLIFGGYLKTIDA